MASDTDQNGETGGDLVVAFDYDGQRYRLANGDMTASERLAWRQTLGIPFLSMVQQGLDIDVIAGVVWIIERRTNPNVTYERIAGRFRWADFEMVVEARAEEPAEADDPDPTEPAGS